MGEIRGARGGNPYNWNWEDEMFYINSLDRHALILYRKATEKRDKVMISNGANGMVSKEKFIAYIENRLLNHFNIPMAHLQDIKDQLKGPLH